MISLPLDGVAKAAANRPQGYLEDMLSFATEITETEVRYQEEAYFSLIEKYQTPTIKEQVLGAAQSFVTWAKGGLAIAPEPIRKERAAICEACEFWDVSGVYPRCSKCGCCRAKLWMASEACPVGKWEALKTIVVNNPQE